jgi:hypothetical protein
MPPASLQTFIDTRLTLTPSLIPNSNYIIMVSDWNCLQYFCAQRLFDHPVISSIVSRNVAQDDGEFRLGQDWQVRNWSRLSVGRHHLRCCLVILLLWSEVKPLGSADWLQVSYIPAPDDMYEIFMEWLLGGKYRSAGRHTSPIAT